jgi:hypothetical protein
MLSCKEVTHLVSRSLDRRLTWRERLGLQVHLLLCEGCRHFVRQLRFLRAALQRFAGKYPEAALRLPEEARARIGRALKRHD